MTTTQAARRIVTYERTSSEDQRERETIKTQTEEIARKLALEPGVELVDRYVDDGVSGTISMALRPAGRHLMDDAARGRFDEVWIYKVDRLGRDDVDPLLVWKELERLGVKVHSVTEGISDLFMYHIHVAVAAQERRNFLQRSADGMHRAAREGRYTGGIVPLGYRVEGKRPSARLVPDETIIWGDLTAAGLIRLTYHHLVVDCWSCIRIAREYNDLGIPTHYQRDGRGVRGKKTQGKWRAGGIRNMVVRAIYRGEQQYGRRTNRQREIISAQIEPLVSPEIWHAAQEALARNRICTKNTERTYIFRSVIRCGTCGLTYVGTNGRPGKWWYRCNGQLVGRGPIEGRCPSQSLPGHELEPLLWPDIERWLRNPGEVLDELNVRAERDAHEAVAEAQSITLTKALESLEAQRARTVRLHIRGQLSEDDVDAELARIDAERAEVERRLATLQPAEQDAAEPDITPDLLEELRRRLDAGLSDMERQEIVRLLVRIVVHTEKPDGGKKRARLVVEYRFPNLGVGLTGTGTGSSPPRA